MNNEIKQNQNPQKNPVLALFLSFFLPGLGQIYNDQVGKGIGFMALYLVGGTIIVLLCFVLIGFFLTPFLMVFWIYNLVDAYSVAEKINRGISPKLS